MIGVEFVQDRESREPNEGFLGSVVAGAMERGLVTVTCGAYHNVLRHLIPLVITDEELDEGLEVLAAAVAGARTAGRPSR
jgi:4-aminobutyrate aminotransferase/(S)-3-amino-2-methylpropionate transaminase